MIVQIQAQAGSERYQWIPIKGAEVKFLRKSLGLSMERFGTLPGLSPPAILKWERDLKKRLHPTNEVAGIGLMTFDFEFTGVVTASNA